MVGQEVTNKPTLGEYASLVPFGDEWHPGFDLAATKLSCSAAECGKVLAIGLTKQCATASCGHMLELQKMPVI